MSEIEKDINKTLDGIEGIIRNGGNREVKEIKETVKSLDWFKNFGYDICKRIEGLEDKLDIDRE